ncbi:UDP-N-acetylmuramate--L-alanine ligase [Porphyromonas pogonae]|uniref:UDP-N-acetylmuramate--L-alanine ligase n=1 Tax=Porphyromonas pogonae TaxID=867595 RepID=UPI002E7672C9|nr:UDP-N-acetylmuramate--L-alanine ligase [Porphyromonas pogonae]
MNQVYFIGIGGIGMSAIARYFHAKNYLVAGYDLTPSPITGALQEEGIPVHFADSVEDIPQEFKDNESLVVYTPAVPADHTELNFFRNNGYRVLKRSEILGEITRMEKALCVAGTHGKTTTSTLLAHILKQSHVDCNAFLGGIANNYNTNLLLSEHSDLVVVEADEFDRSFHRLSPAMAIVTSADPDHLDIYGTPEAYRESFEHFTSLIQPGGYLLIKKGIPMTPKCNAGVTCLSYAINEEADFYADNIEIKDGKLFFDWHYPSFENEDKKGTMRTELGVPLLINVENAVAAMGLAYLNGAYTDEIGKAVSNFRGSHRRFDRLLNGPKHILIDDYAHHPKELEASIKSVRTLYPHKEILGIFQPHLYSRTSDFYKEFATSLSLLDQIILIDIYPAREKPIPGITSQLIADHIEGKEIPVIPKSELIDLLRHKEDIPEVVLMLGAGDIDRLVHPVKNYLESL